MNTDDNYRKINKQFSEEMQRLKKHLILEKNEMNLLPTEFYRSTLYKYKFN
jgi:hypothetical protein